MKREKITKKQAILLLLSLLLVLVLTAALATGLVLAARERAALEREREEQSALADRLHAGVTRPKHPNNMTGLELIAAGNANLLFMGYFGDETLYGRGAAEELAINTVSYRTMVQEGLGEWLGVAPVGRIYDDNFLNPREEPDHDATTFNPSLSLIAADLAYTAPFYSYRLMLLSPTARTAEAGREGDGGAYTGDFIADLETLLREVRENYPLCNIVLTVPHDADAETAADMLALAAHYGLISVDLRETFENGEGLVHTEGPDLGYPTEDGHRAYADAILAAIQAAVSEGHSITPIPETRLN